MNDDSDDIATVWDAIKRACELPKTVAKVDVLESLTQKAVQLNEPTIAFMGYLHTINACNGAVLPERMLAAYTGMRAIYQRLDDEWTNKFSPQLLHAGAFVISFVDSFP